MEGSGRTVWDKYTELEEKFSNVRERLERRGAMLSGESQGALGQGLNAGHWGQISKNPVFDFQA